MENDDESHKVNTSTNKAVTNYMNAIKEETPRSSSTMSPIEKVSLWLPSTQSRSSTINESQKATLLAQLNGIDKEKNMVAPVPAERLSSRGRMSTNISQQNNFEETSVDRKSHLLNELFGKNAIITEKKDVITSPRPLKTSLKTKVGLRKSVKFYEGEDNNVNEFIQNDLF